MCLCGIRFHIADVDIYLYVLGGEEEMERIPLVMHCSPSPGKYKLIFSVHFCFTLRALGNVTLYDTHRSRLKQYCYITYIMQVVSSILFTAIEVSL